MFVHVQGGKLVNAAGGTISPANLTIWLGQIMTCNGGNGVNLIWETEMCNR